MANTFSIDGEQLARLLRLCRFLRRSGGATFKQLQAALRVSRRTLFRDLSALQRMGIDVAFSDSGYVLRTSAGACKRLLHEHHRQAFESWMRSCLK